MKIGIVGVGKVGGAISFGFRRIGHTVLQHDIRLNTALADVLPADIIFICVPTPPDQNGACDASRVLDVVALLAQKHYRGLVAIKSTVTPGTTDVCRQLHPDLRLAFS